MPGIVWTSQILQLLPYSRASFLPLLVLHRLIVFLCDPISYLVESFPESLQLLIKSPLTFYLWSTFKQPPKGEKTLMNYERLLSIWLKFTDSMSFFPTPRLSAWLTVFASLLAHYLWAPVLGNHNQQHLGFCWVATFLLASRSHYFPSFMR